MKNKKKKSGTAPAPTTVPKKKKHIGLTLFMILLILAAAGCAGYYYYERQKPQKAAEEFMETVRALDFDRMSSMIQSEDLSVFDGTIIRDDVYTEFFRTKCQKLTYEIIKTGFSLTDGTASITMRVNYPDGSKTYKTAMSEFLRKIASSSLTGSKMSKKELNDTFTEILMTTGTETEDPLLVTEITYPMIEIDGQWKVVFLDEETLKVMSANFRAIENEIQSSLEAAENNKEVAMETPVGEDEVFDLETDRFRIHYTQFRISTDIAGKPCLLVYYDYTNNSDEPSCPMIDVSLQAYQNGITLDAAIPETTENALDYFMSEIGPQKTLNICQAFSLIDQSEVTMKASDAFAFGGETTSQIIKVQ